MRGCCSPGWVSADTARDTDIGEMWAVLTPPAISPALFQLFFHHFAKARNRSCCDAVLVESISMPSQGFSLQLRCRKSHGSSPPVTRSVPHAALAAEVGHRVHPDCHCIFFPGVYASTFINLILNIPSEHLSTVSHRRSMSLLINLTDRRFFTNIHSNVFCLIIFQYPTYTSLSYFARFYQSHSYTWCTSELTEFLDLSSVCLQSAFLAPQQDQQGGQPSPRDAPGYCALRNLTVPFSCWFQN